MDVSAFAKGLLGLLNSKDRGRGLSTAAEFIQPMVEITPMLGANTRALISATINPLLTGLTVVATVPAGEVWRVKAGGAHVQCGAGVTAGAFSIWIRPPEGSTTSFLASETRDVAANNQGGVPWVFPDLILNPGTEIRLFAAVVGAPVASFGIYYEPARV